MITTDNPKVTILLATFNRAHLIIETLKSIQNQTYDNFECLITDDNSADDTEAVIKKFIDTDDRFLYFKKPEKYPQGLSASRNFGLDLAEKKKAQYIQFFDDDDIMHPQKLELQISTLIKNNVDFVLCASKRFTKNYEISNEVKELYRFNNFADDYLVGKIHFGAPIPLFRFNYINRNRFDTALFYAEEWVCFTQLFYHYTPRVCLIDTILFYQRKHDNSITLGKDIELKKTKSSKVSGTILVNYLNKNGLHTLLSSRVFANIFLFKTRDERVLNEILSEIKSKNISKVLYFEIIFFRSILKLQSKVFMKISSWI